MSYFICWLKNRLDGKLSGKHNIFFLQITEMSFRQNAVGTQWAALEELSVHKSSPDRGTAPISRIATQVNALNWEVLSLLQFVLFPFLWHGWLVLYIIPNARFPHEIQDTHKVNVKVDYKYLQPEICHRVQILTIPLGVSLWKVSTTNTGSWSQLLMHDKPPDLSIRDTSQVEVLILRHYIYTI